MITKDLLWKGIIEDLCIEFLHYFFSDMVPAIDFEKEFVFLDKELQQIFPESEQNHRYADKLVKVFLKNGEELWLLVHVEVQGYIDTNFSGRMFTMFYRLRELFNVPVVQLAIFTDDSPTYHPNSFHYEKYGTWLDYGYRTWKLLENPPAKDESEGNLFAIVMETAWYGLSKNRLKDDELYKLKTGLIRKLLVKEVGKTKIKKLLGFIEFYINFEKQQFSRKFENQIYKIQKPMGIEELIKEKLLQDAEEKGMEMGIEKGLALAIRQMLEKGFKPKDIAEILEIEPKLVLKIKRERNKKKKD